MKFIYAVSAFVAVAAAQDLSSLPACGQLCVNNMLGLAQSLGCSATDAKCLCGNVNFGNGLRDCASQACGPTVAAQVVAFGTQYCSQAGASISGGGSTTGTAAASAASSASGAVASASSSASSALASASSSISGALASATSSAASAASSGASAASSSAASGASSATSSGFAMKTAAPFAGAGALGALAMLLV